MLVGLDLFIRGGPGLLSPPNWVTEAKGVDGLSEQWPEGGNSTVCNRVTYVGEKRKREKRKQKKSKNVDVRVKLWWTKFIECGSKQHIKQI